MKRAVIRSTSEEGYRTLIVVDATNPSLSMRDVIDSALIGGIVGNDVKIETRDVPDDESPMPGPDEVGAAVEELRAIESALWAADHTEPAFQIEKIRAALGDPEEVR